MTRLSVLQWVRICLGGVVYIGRQTRPGWSGHLPFYAFRCPKHGIVEDYLHGQGRVDCPRCSYSIRGIRERTN